MTDAEAAARAGMTEAALLAAREVRNALRALACAGAAGPYEFCWEFESMVVKLELRWREGNTRGSRLCKTMIALSMSQVALSRCDVLRLHVEDMRKRMDRYMKGD